MLRASLVNDTLDLYFRNTGLENLTFLNTSGAITEIHHSCSTIELSPMQIQQE